MFLPIANVSVKEINNMPTDIRHNSRRIALAHLYTETFHQDDTPEAVSAFAEVNNITNYETTLYNKIITGVHQHQAEIDQIITKYAPDWEVDQIDPIDLTCLRIALFELHFDQDNPAPLKVAIDEGVELAKEYGGEQSSSFINGVLGSFVREEHQEAQ